VDLGKRRLRERRIPEKKGNSWERKKLGE